MSTHTLAALPSVLRLGTRGSLLARTQSQLIADLLAPHLPAGTTIQLVTISTTGDALSAAANTPPNAPALTAPTAAFDKGNFTREIDEQLLAGNIDFAVHSAKDLPVDRPAGIILAATPPRENPADVWIGAAGLTIDQLPKNAKVGTASLRRQAQLLARRPDLQIVPLRGNIDTRLRKVAAQVDGLAGTFLAAAGLLRTGLLPPEAVVLPTDQFIPAAGQGILALEARRPGILSAAANRDAAILDLLANINHEPTAAALTFERSIVRSLSGNCLAPIGVCAEPRTAVRAARQGEQDGNTPQHDASRVQSGREAGPNSQIEGGWIARAIVASPDGKDVARCTLMARDRAEHGSAAASLQELASLMLQTLERRGAGEILRRLSQ